MNHDCSSELAELQAACTAFDLACVLRDQKQLELQAAEQLKQQTFQRKQEAQAKYNECQQQGE